MSMHKTAKLTPVLSTVDVEQQIRERAYELYEQRGREEGHDLEDWLQAEAEIKRGKTRATAA